MRQNFHFKSFFTFLSRNKIYTGINIFGFAVSMMFVILLGLYLQKEYTVDSFHENKDRIYRLEHEEGSWYSGALPSHLESHYPEIEATTRVYMMGVDVETQGTDIEKYREGGLFVDSAFFRIFSFPFLEGDASTAMPTRNDVVLTESFARKLFGDAPATGKMLKIKDRTYTVSAVLRDIKHSHIRNHPLLIRMDNFPEFWGADGILTSLQSSNEFSIYLLGRPNADLKAKESDMYSFFRHEIGYGIFGEGELEEVRLNPLPELYFSEFGRGFEARNNRNFLMIVGITALVILLFAVINYINLSIAQAGFRAKEAATRRLLGETRRQLLAGFISESVLMCGVSFILGLGLALLAEPIFQQIMLTDLTVAEGLTWINLGWAVAGVVLLGIVSGLMPALVMTGFKPIDVVRGTFRRQTKMVYSKVLIAFQYCITIVLIGCTLTILLQVEYMKKAEVGYDKEYVITARNPVTPPQRPGFRTELLAVPGVEDVAFANAYPGSGNYSGMYFFRDNDGVNQDLATFYGDSNYLSLLRFEVIHRTGVEDPSAAYLNEKAWKELGLAPDATEYTNVDGWRQFKIRGMVRDFHADDFSEPVGGAIIVPLPAAEAFQAHRVLIRVSPSDPFETMKRIETIYNKRAGGNLFNGQFISQALQDQYYDQMRLSQILGILSGLALVISALGMLAMATYYARQRAQEVAVRKVFGAMTREVLSLLMFSFLKLVLIAFVIAIPLIWIGMQEWLTGYAYRISLSWSIFAMAGLTAFLIAALTVLWQSLKVAHTQPVEALKNQ